MHGDGILVVKGGNGEARGCRIPQTARRKKRTELRQHLLRAALGIGSFLKAPIVDAQGFMSLTIKAFEQFGSDLPERDARVAAATQGPINVSAFGAQVSSVAWKTKPCWYIVSKLDAAIAPDEERFFAKRMKATTTELDTSHVAMLSQPEAVARIIMDATAKALNSSNIGAR